MLSEINQLPKDKFGMILRTKYPRSHTHRNRNKTVVVSGYGNGDVGKWSLVDIKTEFYRMRTVLEVAKQCEYP